MLAAKGVTYDFVPVDPQNPPEDLIDLNPYHSVPTLVERELVLYAASVVSEYLDERYPHPPLMPVDPLSRARIRLAMLRIEHDWVPQVQAIQLGNKTRAEAGRKRLKELLTSAVPLFKASKFFLNPEMSPPIAPWRRSSGACSRWTCRCPRMASPSRITATAFSAIRASSAA